MNDGGDSALIIIYGAVALLLLLGLLLYEFFYARRHKLATPLPIAKHEDLVEQQPEEGDDLQKQIDAATAKLRKANAELQRLDDGKDEFVSMASHQLRTPLTSIKGYLSMVLEGDAGELNREQRKLLQEAFTSSERMVRLIGDFLNVSRLQNGKFMIDRSMPVNLADVVEQEIDNVDEIASSRGIGIAYHKPKGFPVLYLDEEKIRQVIMNYLDNAVYYSPESKVITVRLYKSDGAVVLEVVDRGMGVPKNVQKRLFTKFFRAENAQKQRPDGTGIGLYLAKMVTTGHGGKVVFESTEGKGSKFGFRLPIKKLSTPVVEAE